MSEIKTLFLPKILYEKVKQDIGVNNLEGNYTMKNGKVYSSFYNAYILPNTVLTDKPKYGGKEPPLLAIDESN